MTAFRLIKQIKGVRNRISAEINRNSFEIKYFQAGNELHIYHNNNFGFLSQFHPKLLCENEFCKYCRYEMEKAMKINFLKCFVIVAAVLQAGCTTARAETLLRNKFTPGETRRYVMNLDQTFTITRQDNNETNKVTKNMTVDMVNKVESVDGKGNASITVLMDRVRITVKGSQVVTLDYDTASQEKPKGPTKILALIYDVLTKRPFTIKESALGKISDVKPPEGLSEAVKKASTAATQINDTVPSEEELSDPIKNGNGIIFPEGPVSEGKTWSMNEDKKYYARMGPYVGEGVQKVTTTFRYLGKENKDGKIFDKISVTETLRSPGKIKVPTDPNIKVEVNSMSTEGTIYFDNAAGAMVDYDSHSEMKMAITGNNNGQQMNMSAVFTSVNTTKLVPTDAKSK